MLLAKRIGSRTLGDIIATNIEHMKEVRGVTYNDLKDAGITAGTFANLKYRRTRILQQSTVEGLCRAFNITEEELMDPELPNKVYLRVNRTENYAATMKSHLGGVPEENEWKSIDDIRNGYVPFSSGASTPALLGPAQEKESCVTKDLVRLYLELSQSSLDTPFLYETYGRKVLEYLLKHHIKEVVS